MKIPLVGCGNIIKEHYKTLKEDSNNFWIASLFFFVPIIMTAFIIYYCFYLSLGSASALITGFTLFSGLLINVLLLLYMIVERKPRESNQSVVILLKHLYANTLYAILISISVISLLIVYIILYENIDIYNGIGYILVLSILVYFLTIHFFANLLMIIRRLFILLFEN